MADIQLDDMRMFGDALECRIDRFAGERVWVGKHLAPLQGGLLAVLGLVFVAQRDAWPIRQGQSDIKPRLADVDIQVAFEADRREVVRAVITSGVVEIFSVRVVAGAHEAEVWLAQLQRHAIVVLVEHRPASNTKFAVRADRPAQFEMFVTRGKPLLLPPILAKLSSVAGHTDIPHSRRDRECRLPDWPERVGRPFRALVDPGAQ